MAVIGASPSNISKVRLAQQSAKPAAPAAGFWLLWVESDGVHILNSADSETILGAGSALTVAEIDANPSGTPTTLQFPNGTLSDEGAGVYRYTPAAGAGGADLLEVQVFS